MRLGTVNVQGNMPCFFSSEEREPSRLHRAFGWTAPPQIQIGRDLAVKEELIQLSRGFLDGMERVDGMPLSGFFKPLPQEVLNPFAIPLL